MTEEYIKEQFNFIYKDVDSILKDSSPLNIVNKVNLSFEKIEGILISLNNK